MDLAPAEIDRRLDEILRQGSSQVGEAGSMSRVMVMLTRSCELRCSYCLIELSEEGFGSAHEGSPGAEWRSGLPPRGDMSRDTLWRIIDELMSSTRPRLGIQFFGGEPTRCWETLIDGVERALAHSRLAGRQIELLLTTNGVGLDAAKIGTLAGFPVTVELSLDGDAEGSRFRRGHLLPHDEAVQRLFANAEALRATKLRWFMNTTLPPAAAGEIVSRYQWAREAGIPALQLNYATGMHWTAEQMKAYLDGLVLVLEDHAARPAGLELYNWQNGADPVPLCGDVIVDVDGTLFQTGAIFHEKRYPALKAAYHRGHLESATGFDSARIPLRRLYEVTREALEPAQWEVFEQNVRFGAAIDLAVRLTAARVRRPGRA
jgi:pyruvate-formate lyase-activating enzyme